MQVTVNEVSSLTRKLTVIVPPDVARKKLDTAYDELNRGVNLKGFRKGKVPRAVLEKSFSSRVENEIAEKLIQDTYFDALAQTKLDAVVHPEVSKRNFSEDGSFIYEALVDIRPQFELKEYKGVSVELPTVTVSEEEVVAELEKLRREHAPLMSVEREVADGDLVLLDFQAFHEGKAMSQVGGTNYTAEVGSGRNGVEFETGLIGLKKGVEESRDVTFAANFSNPVLAGKTISFKFLVHDIKERILPALDDEFAKDAGKDVDSLDALKKLLHDRIESQKKDRQNGELSDKIMQKLLEVHSFEVPRRLAIYEAEALVKQTEENLKRQGISIESAGLSRDTLAEGYREVAEKRVRGDFVIKKIGEVEDIKLSDEDIKQGFQRVAAQYGMQVEQVREFFKNRNDFLPFLNELLNEKIIEFLRDQAVVSYIESENTGA